MCASTTFIPLPSSLRGGITAGSTFATTELRILLTSVVERAYVIWPSVSIQLYIDDMTIASSGTPAAAAHVVSQVVKFVTTHLVRGLSL